MALGFGRDLAGADGIRSARYSTGLQLVGEACVRRLTSPRGSLWFGGQAEQNYGIDLSEGIGVIGPERHAQTLPGRIRAELSKDDRVASVNVDVSVATLDGAATITIQIKITAHDLAGEYPFTLAVSEVGVSLLRR